MHWEEPNLDSPPPAINNSIQSEEAELHSIGTSSSSWWSKSYAVDWATNCILFILTVIISQFVGLLPFHRYVIKHDPITSYPNLPSIVPTWSLIIICNVTPLTVFGIAQIFAKKSWHRWHDFHHAMLAWFTATVWTIILTNLGKLYAGRERPDYQARIDPKTHIADADASESFPSGHSSWSFATMVVVSLYLCGKFGLFRRNGGHSWRVIASLWPIFASSLIAMSRTRDYHHNFADIVAGSLIGAGFGAFSYFLYFRPLTSEACAIPKIRKTTF